MTEFQCWLEQAMPILITVFVSYNSILADTGNEQILIVRCFGVFEESSHKSVNHTILWLFLGEIQQITEGWAFKKVFLYSPFSDKSSEVLTKHTSRAMQ